MFRSGRVVRRHAGRDHRWSRPRPGRRRQQGADPLPDRWRRCRDGWPSPAGRARGPGAGAPRRAGPPARPGPGRAGPSRSARSSSITTVTASARLSIIRWCLQFRKRARAAGARWPPARLRPAEGSNLRGPLLQRLTIDAATPDELPLCRGRRRRRVWPPRARRSSLPPTRRRRLCSGRASPRRPWSGCVGSPARPTPLAATRPGRRRPSRASGRLHAPQRQPGRRAGRAVARHVPHPRGHPERRCYARRSSSTRPADGPPTPCSLHSDGRMTVTSRHEDGGAVGRRRVRARAVAGAGGGGDGTRGGFRGLLDHVGVCVGRSGDHSCVRSPGIGC